MGLEAPLITPALISAGLGGFLDHSLLQPLFIGLIIVAIYGQFKRARQELSFMSLILEFVFGIIAFLFIFIFKIQIVGYLAVLGQLYVIFRPVITKFLRKGKVTKIKA